MKTGILRQDFRPKSNIKTGFREEVCSGGYLVYLARHVTQQLTMESNEQENGISDSIKERGFLTK
jgi:hypothetical protein